MTNTVATSARRARRRAQGEACSFCGDASFGGRLCSTCGATPGTVPEALPLDDARVELGFRADGRFGLCEHLPGGALRRLTYGQHGHTNNTRVRVGGATPLLGELECVLPMKLRGAVVSGVWGRGSLRVSQRLSVVTGRTTQTPDTARVDYLVWNRGQGASQKVGLRVMIDTLIGGNDGVPFVVPGRQGILAHSEEFQGDAVPAYVQAIERPDPLDPGAIVHLGLRGGDATPPQRLVIDHWPGSNAGYGFFRGRGKGWGHDSAVGCYWPARSFAAGELRRVTFFYGLGGMSSLASGNRRLSITAPRRAGPSEQIMVGVRVFDPRPGEAIRLEAPQGFAFAPGSGAEQRIEADAGDHFAFASWELLTPAQASEGALRAVLAGEHEETQRIRVAPRA